jgi:hypothetical protein
MSPTKPFADLVKLEEMSGKKCSVETTSCDREVKWDKPVVSGTRRRYPRLGGGTL